MLHGTPQSALVRGKGAARMGERIQSDPPRLQNRSRAAQQIGRQSCDGMGIRADSPPDPALGPALAKWASAPCEPHTRHGPAWLFELIDLVGEGA